MDPMVRNLLPTTPNSGDSNYNSITVLTWEEEETDEPAAESATSDGKDGIK